MSQPEEKISGSPGLEKTAGDSPRHRLILTNESGAEQCFIVSMSASNPAAYQLAWQTTPFFIRSNNSHRFEWHPNYCFVWSETGRIEVGKNIFIEETKDAPVNSEITFSGLPAPGLSELKPSGRGLIFNYDDRTPIVEGRFGVGIGLSGIGTEIGQVRHTAHFTEVMQFIPPEPPVYRLSASDSLVDPGTILEKELDNSLDFAYPTSITKLHFAFTEDGRWEARDEQYGSGSG